LRTIYDHLVDTELAIKTGQQDAPMALELFVLECVPDT
jgi:DNA polymerase III delta subunit